MTSFLHHGLFALMIKLEPQQSKIYSPYLRLLLLACELYDLACFSSCLT